MRLAVLALAALLLAAPASATTVTQPTGAPYQWWTDAALTPEPPGTVVVVNSPCPNYEPHGLEVGACYDAAHRTIYLNGAKAGNRAMYLHELGHDFDATVMTDAYRDGFRRIVRERRAWWDTDPSGEGSPGERFATAYSVCARRREIARDGYLYGPGHGYGYRPTLGQHRRVCALIRRAAGYG